MPVRLLPPVRLLLPGVLLALGLASLPDPAAADPPPWAGHGRHHGREWRQDRWERERRERARWERHEARRVRRDGHAIPAPAYAPPPGYPPPPPADAPPYPVPGIGVFVPFR